MVIEPVRTMPRIDRAVRLHPPPAPPAKMSNASGGDIEYLPSRLPCLKTVIGVFLIGKIALIQVPDLIDDFAPDKHAGSGDAVHRINRIFGKVVQVVTAEKLAAREKLRQP